MHQCPGGRGVRGAAFGEHILGLFRMGESTVLVTGISSKPATRSAGDCSPKWPAVTVSPPSSIDRARSCPADSVPANELRLGAGDQLKVVLATINGLQRIEQG